MGFSVGGLSFGSSRSSQSASSQSSSQTSSSSSSRSSQDVFLADLYSQLFGGASDAAAGIDTSGLTDAANMLFNTGGDFLGLLEGAGGGSSPDFAGAPVSARGVDNISVPGSTVEAEIAQLEGDLGRFFSEQINPAITDTAIQGRALGGGRQGVAQGLAAEGVAGEFARGATDIRSRDIDRRLAVAERNQATSLAGAGLELEAGKFSSQLALEADRLGADYDLASRGLGLEGAKSALGFLPEQLDILSSGAYAALSPYLMLAQILDDPTVLSQSQSESESAGESSSSSSSTGKSKAFNFGIS